MKKIFTTIVCAGVLFISSCEGANTQTKENNSTAVTSTGNPGKMKEFIALLDGTDGCTKNAAAVFFNEDLKNSQAESNKLVFADFTLQDAKVVSVDGSCCTMEAKAGVTTRSFILCWQDDKVTSIEDLGIK